MKLLIVESPSKAKTISKYLEGQYKVVASVGHIRDLPKSNKQAVDILGGFVPHYEVVPEKASVVSDIKRLAKEADEIYLATDPDREGEAIAWHIAEACGLRRPKRVVFYEITKRAVQEAIKHPRNIDQDLRKAQEARRVLDRLVGYDLSGLIWKKLRYGLSAGRVQSPALRILAEREREIQAFNPEDFWIITATATTKNKQRFVITCTEEPRSQKRTDEIVRAAANDSWEVTGVKQTQAKRAPYPPFTTSTLQQAASSRLGYSPSITMRLAQKLYEKGLITYMRTDSVTMSREAQTTIADLIDREFGARYATPRQYVTKSKNAQEAHEAIRPTDVSVKSGGATGQEKKLYELIRIRAITSQMADAELLRTRITANTVKRSVPDFVANGSHLLFPGWLALDKRARQDDIEVPPIESGDPLSINDIDALGKQTEPPRRYSEAGLVKELEKRGIGRPSTYASIIKTLYDRQYVIKDGRSLRPTDTGDVVSGFLENHFADIVSDTFTAGLEEKLDEIAEGKRDYTETLSDFYTPFAKQVKSKESIERITNLGEAPKSMKCPECGGPMVLKLGRGGKFYSCARFPDCQGALTLEGETRPNDGPKETGEDCPQCGGKLVERQGLRGSFVACGNYPKCKYIKKDGTPPVSSGVKCPVCQKGEMVERRGRFGIFYSCSDYPACKHAIKTKPTGNICDYKRADRDGRVCSALMMEGTKTIPERCSDKTCPNHNPHKLNKK